jgi:hypothetical protein
MTNAHFLFSELSSLPASTFERKDNMEAMATKMWEVDNCKEKEVTQKIQAAMNLLYCNKA